MTDTNDERTVTAEELGRFWGGGGHGGNLAEIAVGNVAALRRLGASPFAGAGFPVLGFLETLYEEVGVREEGAANKAG